MTINILTFTTLYPNKIKPHHGVFVENRLRHLLAFNNKIKSKVIAPVPWFPFKSRVFGLYSDFARVAARETRHGISIVHPRYPIIPKIGMAFTPFSLAFFSLPYLKSLISTGYNFDIIDAHYFYPDGVAAAILGKILHKPVVITARGTDINLIPKYSIPRKMILWAANNSQAMITVCNALREELVHIGADPDKVISLRNGVDLEMFSPPLHRNELRRQLNISGKTILSVGHLIERKGHDLIIQALACLENINLLIAGTGPEEQKLKSLAKNLGVNDRVTFLGVISHDSLKKFYGAVDITVLASSREGWANVLLESMACGTPVVATNIWGTPEVVASAEAGLLTDERTPKAIAKAIGQLYQNYPERGKTRKYAENFNWDATSKGQLEIFSRITQQF